MNLLPTYRCNFFWFTTAAYHAPNTLNSSRPSLWAILINSHLTRGSSCRDSTLMPELDSHKKQIDKIKKPVKLSKCSQTLTQYFNIFEATFSKAMTFGDLLKMAASLTPFTIR